MSFKTEVADCANTYFVILDDNSANEIQIAEFRSTFASRLCHPPPAVLIGIPDDRYASYPLLTSITPPSSIGSSSQTGAILLSSTQRDIRPITIAIFAAQSISALHELSIHIESGK